MTVEPTPPTTGSTKWDLVIVIDGDPPVPGWRHLVSPGATVIAADGGARHARTEAVTVTDLIGDLDTLTPDEVTMLVNEGVRVHRFDRDKDLIDFELAARLAKDRSQSDVAADTRPILVIGGAGGRLDHALGNIAVLGGFELSRFAVTALMGDAFVRVASPDRPVTVTGQADQLVSLIPLAGAVHGVRTHGLRYVLDHHDLDVGRTLGVSNVVESDPATITVEAGTLLVIFPTAVAGLIDRYHP